MPIPITLVIIPIFLGIMYVTPFEQPEEPKPEFNSEPSSDVLFFGLMLIWIMVLLRILVQFKKGTFRITQRY